MRPKAIRDLGQLGDAGFFTELACGWELVLHNVRRLVGASELLTKAERYHAARLLETVAQEEAAKILILTDAARCPREPGQRFVSHLARFNDHLAKGLYARACDMRPANLDQLQSYLDLFRIEYYLDGPNDVDWIFRNEVTEQRENVLYVDYVATDEGHHWADPSRFAYVMVKGAGLPTPGSVRIAEALWEVGIGSEDGLRAVSEIWRPARIDRRTHYEDFRNLNIETLERLERLRLLEKATQKAVTFVTDEWHFPIYDLDLTMLKVKQDELRERQRAWNPDW
jgi:AbiV family abortive infection protein